MGLGFHARHEPASKEEEYTPTCRTYIRCTICMRTFYYDKINERSRGRTCKCGNLWVGITKPSDMRGSKYKFYVAIKYKTERPEIAEKKINRRKPQKGDNNG